MKVSNILVDNVTNNSLRKEILQKRAALKNVLVPETLDGHRRRLGHAGFSPLYVWFQCFNFVSFVAFK